MSPAAQPLPEGVQTHPGSDRGIGLFYTLVGVLLLTLVGGLARQQLLQADMHYEREQRQGLRRVIVPGPRGRIFDREGRLLAGSRPRFAVTLALDELGAEFRAEYRVVRDNYRAAAGKDQPTTAQLEQIARTSVVQRRLDSLDGILGRHTQLDQAALQRHFSEQPLLPYLLLNDLTPEDYARLVEQLPVNSPMQVFASSVREYPLGALMMGAAHTLGYVGSGESAGPPEDFPGNNLDTFQLKDWFGRTGLEQRFDQQLRGGEGGAIFRVTPAGYRINPPKVKITPSRGRDLVTSLDADMQAAAETALGDQSASAVALDVRTGEVFVLASTPGYNLQDFTPRATQAAVDDINARGAFFNRALDGYYPPGSTFKLLISIAGLRTGAFTPDQVMDTPCDGRIRIGNSWRTCFNGNESHGAISLSAAIAESCDIYFYQAGLLTNPDAIAAEARRFHLAARPSLELPALKDRSFIPDPAWKKNSGRGAWFDGDTVNMSIGQGDVQVSPLMMACFAASLARDEVFTQPTLLHDPGAPTQHHERTGLTRVQRDALLAGMEGCTTTGGTAPNVTNPKLPSYIPGLRIAGKTGTAQYADHGAKKNIAWFICFAPAEAPRIAVAVAVESDELGRNESFVGGTNAAPIAQKILKVWSDKQARAAATAPAGQTISFPLPSGQ